ncbi:NAD(P)-binding protein [Mytilinidion resinicola]|uniref:NAD(P)-binding protein n=1 Tax=Mytilinidion resinicola TaxID=574789 RepID=A0A6A6YL52_9PEZI|nr:NAD(P)-binding protein [Mytilinidion resinicola]KAF2809258.1 NAD(P)-binding protein [Mytilinidion resinicola]
MSRPLVLVTGATGHIGFAILALLLKKGYRTRVASRKLSSAEKLKDLPSLEPYVNSISFIEVPDFTADGAFDEAVKDVDYIQHIASPIPDGATSGEISDALSEFINPAVKGNLAILQAATKSPSVKRIIITSSTEILDPKEGATTMGPDDVPGPVPLDEVKGTTNQHFAYRQSKRHSGAAVETFIKEKKPHFDVLSILPSFVQGRNEPVTTIHDLLSRPTSNYVMIDQVLGKKSERPSPIDLVFLDDVALTHVAAMESRKVKSGGRFIAAYTRPIPWEEVDPIVERLFPEEVKSGLLPLGGKHPGVGRAKDGFDSSKTTEILGVEFRGLEDMVQSLIGQLVELKKKDKEN